MTMMTPIEFAGFFNNYELEAITAYITNPPEKEAQEFVDKHDKDRKIILDAYSALYHEVGNLTKEQSREWYHNEPIKAWQPKWLTGNSAATWQVGDQALPFTEEES